MTSLNGIWPAECLGCVWVWCQSKSKQVPWRAVFITSCNSETFLQGNTHLFQWESPEKDSLGSSIKVCIRRVLNLCVWRGHGVGEEMKSNDGKNNRHCHQHILLQDEGVHPAAVSTVQHILHIYIYQVFPRSLLFALNPPRQRSLVKLLL
jgi:hypothetical protein